MSTPVEPIVMLRVCIWCRDDVERHYEKPAPPLPACVTWHKGMKIIALDELLEVEYVAFTDEHIVVELEDINWEERFSWKELDDVVHNPIFTPERNGWTQF